MAAEVTITHAIVAGEPLHELRAIRVRIDPDGPRLWLLERPLDTARAQEWEIARPFPGHLEITGIGEETGEPVRYADRTVTFGTALAA